MLSPPTATRASDHCPLLLHTLSSRAHAHARSHHGLGYEHLAWRDRVRRGCAVGALGLLYARRLLAAATAGAATCARATDPNLVTSACGYNAGQVPSCTGMQLCSGSSQVSQTDRQQKETQTHTVRFLRFRFKALKA